MIFILYLAHCLTFSLFLDLHVTSFLLNCCSWYFFWLFRELFTLQNNKISITLYLFYWLIHHLLRSNPCFCFTCLSHTIARKIIINHVNIMQIWNWKKNNCCDKFCLIYFDLVHDGFWDIIFKFEFEWNTFFNKCIVINCCVKICFDPYCQPILGGQFTSSPMIN